MSQAPTVGETWHAISALLVFCPGSSSASRVACSACAARSDRAAVGGRARSGPSRCTAANCTSPCYRPKTACCWQRRPVGQRLSGRGPDSCGDSARVTSGTGAGLERRPEAAHIAEIAHGIKVEGWNVRPTVAARSRKRGTSNHAAHAGIVSGRAASYQKRPYALPQAGRGTRTSLAGRPARPASQRSD